MITEDYVSFETAKLLKDKGFDEATIGYYYTISEIPEKIKFFDSPISIYHSDGLIGCIQAPTLQMAMKWLREVHYYNIEIDTLGMMELNTLSWRSAVYYLVNQNECYCEDGFDSYEEACEAAIKYCLENLI